MLIELTARCNHHCSYCHSSASRSPHVPSLTAEDYSRLFAEGVRHGWNGVILSGGEPLLRSDLLEIMTSARHEGLAVDLCTNATLVDDTMALNLAACLSEVSVSLDGPAAYHDGRRGSGTFNRAIGGLRRLVKGGIAVHLIAVVDGQSPADIQDLVSLAVDEGVDSLSLLGVMSVGSNTGPPGTGDREGLLRLARECAGTALTVNSKRLRFEPPLGGCPAGRTVFAVSAAGELRPCILLDSPASSVRAGLAAAMADLDPARFRQQLAFRGRSCSRNQRCGMGCPAEGWSADRVLGCDRQCLYCEQ